MLLVSLVLHVCVCAQVIVFERGDLVFAFNFHHSSSYTDYRIGAPRGTTYAHVQRHSHDVWLYVCM